MTLSNLNVTYKIADKTKRSKDIVLKLLHEYPDHFLQGLFEPVAESDFLESIVVIAYDNEKPIGCLMYNPTSHEFSWLAVSKLVSVPKRTIAQGMFAILYEYVPNDTAVHLFVNTEDASIEGCPNFSGRNFEPARNLYKSMGFEFNERIDNKFGVGAHAYKVVWAPVK